jgi:hypothetical protein
MRIESVYDEIDQRKNAALDGEVNELIVFMELSKIEDYAKAAKDEIKSAALQTLENRYNGKAEECGFIFEKTQSGRYDYSQIPEWVTETAKLKEIEKRAQDAYKSAVNNVMSADADGCVIQSAIYKPSAPSIKLTAKKVK